MNILIVGGTGVLSTAVVHEALRLGINVLIINRGNRPHLIPNNVELIKSDKNNFNFIKSKLKNQRFDAIMDFLCYTDEETTQSFNFYSQYTNQYFFISSCAVYNTALGGIFKEDSPKTLPIWKYSVKKWESEKHLVSLAKNSETHYTIIRPCVTYGNTRIPYGISPQYGYHWTLIERILNDKPIIRWNEGINRCNMMRVEDFAIGLVGLIGNPKAYNEVYNICGDETPSFNDVLDVLSELLGKKIKVIDIISEFYAKELPSRKGEILARSIDGINSNEKIKNIVPSFKQTIFLKDGIAQTLNAYKNNNYQNGIDWKFDADTDRIIKKWCLMQNINIENLNLHFIDYLNNATFNNKIRYWLEYNKDYMFVKSLKYGMKIIKKLK